MQLTIIIISYRCRDVIERCLRSIQCKASHEIIIIDNDNDPKLMEKLSKHPHARIIPYKKNLGFSGANNIGISLAKGKYIMTLNADAFPKNGYIDSCLSFLKNNPEYSSIQGHLLLYGQKGLTDSTGNILTRSSFAYSRDHRKKDAKTPSGEIFGVCAAAAIYEKDALEKIKIGSEYFDDDFFAYLEDVDLDWRLRLLGKRAYYLSTAQAYHIRGHSTNNSFRFRQAVRNRLFMIIKNGSWPRMVINLIFYTPLMLIITKDLKNISLIRKMFKKRAIIQKKRAVSHKNIRDLMAPTPYEKYLKKIMQI